jgi:transposase
MARKEIDWKGIKAEWLAGQLSIRAIAKAFGVSEKAIRDRAKSEKWPARKSAVRRKSAPKNRKSAIDNSAEQSAEFAENSIVPAEEIVVSRGPLVHPIERIFELVLHQRVRVKRLLSVVDSCFKDLEELMLIAELSDPPNDEAEGAGEQKPGRSMPGKLLRLKVEIMQVLTSVIRQIHAEERRVFGISEDMPTELDRMSSEELAELRQAIRSILTRREE